MDEMIKEIEGAWKKEFQYLLNGKILSRDELGYLFGQVQSIIDQEKTPLLSRIKELEGFIKENYPSDHFDLVVRIKKLEEGRECL